VCCQHKVSAVSAAIGADGLLAARAVSLAEVSTKAVGCTCAPGCTGWLEGCAVVNVVKCDHAVDGARSQGQAVWVSSRSEGRSATDGRTQSQGWYKRQPACRRRPESTNKSRQLQSTLLIGQHAGCQHTLTEVVNVLFRPRVLSNKVEVCIQLCHPTRGPSCTRKRQLSMHMAVVKSRGCVCMCVVRDGAVLAAYAQRQLWLASQVQAVSEAVPVAVHCSLQGAERTTSSCVRRSSSPCLLPMRETCGVGGYGSCDRQHRQQKHGQQSTSNPTPAQADTQNAQAASVTSQ
jgi:hypothetical protein